MTICVQHTLLGQAEQDSAIADNTEAILSRGPASHSLAQALCGVAKRDI
jgi:hypothetical protein